MMVLFLSFVIMKKKLKLLVNHKRRKRISKLFWNVLKLYHLEKINSQHQCLNQSIMKITLIQKIKAKREIIKIILYTNNPDFIQGLNSNYKDVTMI